MKDKQTPHSPKRMANGLGVLAVQTVSCAVVLLAVLIVRLLGGNLFAQLRQYFHQAMQENTLTTALEALWEEETQETTNTTAPIAGAVVLASDV